MGIWRDSGAPIKMMLFSLMIMVLAIATTTSTTENNALIKQEEGTNKQQPLKYIFHSQFLPPFQAAHPSVVHHLPLMYQVPVQHLVPSAVTPLAGTPPTNVFLQRLMHAPVEFPVASLPHYARVNDDKPKSGCLGLMSKCLNIPIRYQSIMMESAPGQPFTYARNPVLQPILLEEDVESQANYGPPFYCILFIMKHGTDLACLSQLPDSVLQTVCEYVPAILSPADGIPFCRN